MQVKEIVTALLGSDPDEEVKTEIVPLGPDSWGIYLSTSNVQMVLRELSKDNIQDRAAIYQYGRSDVST
jgi:hypothetical protein